MQQNSENLSILAGFKGFLHGKISEQKSLPFSL